MPVEPIHSSLLGVDMTPRIAVYTTVDASPAAAAETVIATLTIPNFANIAVVSGIVLEGWAAYTVGTSGTAVQLRIRQTNGSGTVKANTGAMTGSQHGAGILTADEVRGFDSGAGVGTYVLTMQVTAGAAASTVSALLLQATIL